MSGKTGTDWGMAEWAGSSQLVVSSARGWLDSGSSCPNPTLNIPNFQVLSKDEVNFTSGRKLPTWQFRKCRVIFSGCKAGSDHQRVAATACGSPKRAEDERPNSRSLGRSPTPSPRGHRLGQAPLDKFTATHSFFCYTSLLRGNCVPACKELRDAQFRNQSSYGVQRLRAG